MRYTKIKRNNLDNDQHAMAISDVMVKDIIRGMKDMIMILREEVAEKGNLQITNRVNKRLLNQLLKDRINEMPLQILCMIIDQMGDEIRDDMLEVMGSQVNAQNQDYVFKTILLAKEKAKRKWVYLNISEDYEKF